MKGEDLKKRTMELGIRVLRMASPLPKDYATQVFAHRIIRSSSSVGANYRSACRSKSKKDFINKLKTVEEELDETIYWLELIIQAGCMPEVKLKPLMNECHEVLAIMVSSLRTVRSGVRKEDS